MEFSANRPKVLELLPLPTGVSFRCGSAETLPDDLLGRGYREFGITNETLTGIAARARMAKAVIGAIDVFAGIGTAVKGVIQAAILRPRDYLGFIDISGQNVFDSILLVSALRSGYQTISDFLKTSEGNKFMVDLSHIVPDVIGYGYKLQEGRYNFLQSEIVRKDHDSVGTIDYDFARGLRLFDLSAADCMKTVQQVNRIQICLDSIRSKDVIATILGFSGSVVVDSSNVPLYGSGLYSSRVDPLIFFGFNGTNEAEKECQVPEHGYSKGRYGIHYWSYPLNDTRTHEDRLEGGMTVGMGYFKKEYQSIVNKVDNGSPQW